MSLENLASVKKKLQTLGISTLTPGLSQDDRFEELLYRLESTHNNKAKQDFNETQTQTQTSNHFQNLEFSEIRSRLIALGESTNTLGLTGEDRKKELLNRLIRSICGLETQDNLKLHKQEVIPNEIPNEVSSPSYYTIEMPVENEYKRPISSPPPLMNSSNNNDTEFISIPSADYISEMKNDLKRLMNKRALVVASRLSGPTQDSTLKDLHSHLQTVEAEYNRIKLQKQKSSSVKSEKASSKLVENALLIGIEKLLSKLDSIKTETKEQLRLHRQLIRDEEDANTEYGVGAEDKLKSSLNTANKDNTRGRVKKKIEELKALGNDIDKQYFKPKGKSSISIAPKSFHESALAYFPEELVSSFNDTEIHVSRNNKINNNKINNYDDIKQTTNKYSSSTGIVNVNRKGKEGNIHSSSYSNFDEDWTYGDDEEGEDDDDHRQGNTDIGIIDKEAKHSVDGRHTSTGTAGVDMYSSEIDIAASSQTRKKNTGGNLVSLLARLEEEEKLFAANITAQDKDRDKDKDNYRGTSDALQAQSKQIANRCSPPKSSSSHCNDDGPTTIISPMKAPKDNSCDVNYSLVDNDNDNDNSEDEEDNEEQYKSPQSPANTFWSPGPSAGPNPAESKSPLDESAGAIPMEEYVLASAVASNDEYCNTGTGHGPIGVSPIKAARMPGRPRSSSRYSESDEDSESDGRDNDEDRTGDEDVQIRTLLEHAKVLEGLNDIPSAELMYTRALELDPIRVHTLNKYAVFLHAKKGELPRAEALFIRGLQICLPKFSKVIDKIIKSTDHMDMGDHQDKAALYNDPLNLSEGLDIDFSHQFDKPTVKVRNIVNLILDFAKFLSRAKGDIESATRLYRKAVELSPDSGRVLATVAHFLCQEGGNPSESVHLFSEAIIAEPRNSLILMRFAKLLRRIGQLGKSELMYIAALKYSEGQKKMHSMAICNYAVFLYQFRKNIQKASELFNFGLERYPKHKGLLKNFATLVKSQNRLRSESK